MTPRDVKPQDLILEDAAAIRAAVEAGLVFEHASDWMLVQQSASHAAGRGGNEKGSALEWYGVVEAVAAAAAAAFPDDAHDLLTRRLSVASKLHANGVAGAPPVADIAAGAVAIIHGLVDEGPDAGVAYKARWDAMSPDEQKAEAATPEPMRHRRVRSVLTSVVLLDGHLGDTAPEQELATWFAVKTKLF